MPAPMALPAWNDDIQPPVWLRAARWSRSCYQVVIRRYCTCSLSRSCVLTAQLLLWFPPPSDRSSNADEAHETAHTPNDFIGDCRRAGSVDHRGGARPPADNRVVGRGDLVGPGGRLAAKQLMVVTGRRARPRRWWCPARRCALPTRRQCQGRPGGPPREAQCTSFNARQSTFPG
jgi:hypothetical protein